MRILKLCMLLGMLSLFACKKDASDPVIPNEEELITTVIIDFESSTDTVQFIFRDLDGDGGNTPVISTESLEQNMVYSGKITVFNESVSPALSITEEIQEEAEAHQFFYTFIDDTIALASYDDQDSNGNPIGLSFTLTTFSPGTTELELILRHSPDKYAVGVSDGLIANAGGETDVQVSFPLVIE